MGSLLTGSALVGMIISGMPYLGLRSLERLTWLFRVGYLGWWLMLIGLALIFVGVILRGLAVLRTGVTGPKPSNGRPPWQ